MKFAPGKLFHAVVITGAALTVSGCASTRPAARPVTDAAAPADGAAAQPGTGKQPTTQSASQCPPGSERPYPPCYWIR